MRLNFMPCETNHIWHYYFNLVVSSYVFVFMFYSAGLQALAKASRQLLVFNQVTRQPWWWTKQYNFVSHDLHEKRVQFPVERNTFVFVLQHGRRDVSWKPAIVWPSHPLLVSFATTYARVTKDNDRFSQSTFYHKTPCTAPPMCWKEAMKGKTFCF